MNILVFGAAGRTGREIVVQALSQGHTVTAFLHAQSLGKVGKLQHFEGNVLNSQDVNQVMQQDFDLVISALGNNHPDLQVCAAGIKNIIDSMKSTSVQRLICISSLGLAPDFNSFYFNQIILPVFLQEVHDDLRQMEEHIIFSDLAWTIVRPPQLIDGPKIGSYRLSISPLEPKQTQISRLDLADFILKETKESRFNKQIVAIGY